MAPVEGSFVVKSMYVLIMKTDRWLKMWGVSMAGEGKERKVAQDIIGDTVLGETVPFSYPKSMRGGEEVQASALCTWCP